MNLKNFKTQTFLSNLIFLACLLTATFGRSFSGIFIFNFRIGELIVAFVNNIFIFLKYQYFYKTNIPFVLLQTLLVIFAGSLIIFKWFI